MLNGTESAKLAFIWWKYPLWEINRESGMWTATTKPTPSSLHFVYAASLGQLEQELHKITDAEQQANTS